MSADGSSNASHGVFLSPPMDRKGRGRPKGSKDTYPRMRKSKFGTPQPSTRSEGFEESPSMLVRMSAHGSGANNDTYETSSADLEENEQSTVKVGEKRGRTSAGRKRDREYQQMRRQKLKEDDMLKTLEEENALRDRKTLQASVKDYHPTLFRSLNYVENKLMRVYADQQKPVHATLSRTAIMHIQRMVLAMSKPPRNGMEVEPGQVEEVIHAVVSVMQQRFVKDERLSGRFETMIPDDDAMDLGRGGEESDDAVGA